MLRLALGGEEGAHDGGDEQRLAEREGRGVEDVHGQGEAIPHGREEHALVGDEDAVGDQPDHADGDSQHVDGAQPLVTDERDVAERDQQGKHAQGDGRQDDEELRHRDQLVDEDAEGAGHPEGVKRQEQHEVAEDEQEPAPCGNHLVAEPCPARELHEHAREEHAYHRHEYAGADEQRLPSREVDAPKDHGTVLHADVPELAVALPAERHVRLAVSHGLHDDGRLPPFGRVHVFDFDHAQRLDGDVVNREGTLVGDDGRVDACATDRPDVEVGGNGQRDGKGDEDQEALPDSLRGIVLDRLVSAVTCHVSPFLCAAVLWA